jgi:hypothetical protein
MRQTAKAVPMQSQIRSDLKDFTNIMSDSKPKADDPNKPDRKVTVAIVEKDSGETIRYSVLEPTDSPFQLVQNYFDDFVKEMISKMRRGEERAFLLYEQAEGLRPYVKDFKIINKPKTIRWERSVMGRRGPGATGSETSPYSVDISEDSVVKKGAFPRPVGDPSVLLDDGGMDEEAIRAAARHAHSLLRTALAEKFSESSRLALMAGLDELMRSTGTTGEPRDDWHVASMDEAAVNLFDAAILLWLESEAASTLPKGMKDGYLDRMRDESERSKRSEDIMYIAKRIEKYGLF